jgi:hypothetical protein
LGTLPINSPSAATCRSARETPLQRRIEQADFPTIQARVLPIAAFAASGSDVENFIGNSTKYLRKLRRIQGRFCGPLIMGEKAPETTRVNALLSSLLANMMNPRALSHLWQLQNASAESAFTRIQCWSRHPAHSFPRHIGSFHTPKSQNVVVLLGL